MMPRLIKLFVSHAKTFSPGYAILEVRIYIDIRLSGMTGKTISSRLLRKKTAYIMAWLDKQFSTTLKRYQAVKPASKTAQPNAPIWTCWWQGEKNAPPTVQDCWDSIRRQAPDHPLIILNRQNYTQYCTFPEEIRHKFDLDLISPQLMSDYVRTTLLAQHGGLWVDATIFADKPIPELVFNLPIFNVKGIRDDYPLANRVADAKDWQVYFIASHPHSATYSFISACLTQYWLRFSTPIDYYLTYYLAKLAREKLAGAQAEYKEIPNNNMQVEMLEPYLRDCDSEMRIRSSEWRADDTFIYKLSWRTIYPACNSQGAESLSAQLLRGECSLCDIQGQPSSGSTTTQPRSSD